MSDVIEKIHGAVVQHGPHSDRIYLMHLNAADPHNLVAHLEALAREKGYGKIFAKIPVPVWPAFKSAHYQKEAVVPGLFNGQTDGYFIARYFSAARQNDSALNERFEGSRPPTGITAADPPDRNGRGQRPVRVCQPSDAEAMSALYRQVFKSYPFPIHQPEYLIRTMHSGVRYFGIGSGAEMAAVAAAEIDVRRANVEMTDFATRPRWRGRGLAGMLLRRMDREAAKKGIKTAYTIARAASVGMNAVFQHNGYRYAGVLTNNTQISGGIQSMVVWYKRLDPAA
jgi:putative beta-lysine N-acetyltransferase